jgi:hypothetical protein
MILPHAPRVNCENGGAICGVSSALIAADTPRIADYSTSSSILGDHRVEDTFADEDAKALAGASA